MADEDEGGYFTVEGTGDIMPTLDEYQVPNFQWIGTFTANPSTDILTTSNPHTQLADEVIMFSTTGTLPAPLQPYTIYRVCSPGLGTNTLKVADSEGWHPPPENPPINITSTGSGLHTMWIRPLENICRVKADATKNFISSEDTSGSRGIYLGDSKRFQLKNISGITASPTLEASHDYWSGESRHRPRTKWRICIGGSGGVQLDLSGSGTADFHTYGYGAKSIWGLGDLGAETGGGESYYSLCGGCAFHDNGGPPGGGGGGAAAGDETISPDRQTKIVYRDQDITNLVRRAQKASSTVENFRIVGSNVSGGAGQWAIN